jgi:putative endonuclease
VRTVAQPEKTESARQRRRRERAGRGAEAAAALWLQLKGYRILAQRVRMPACELDIIARKGRMLVFVEVKSRRTIAAAREAVTPELRRRLEQAAHQWSGRLRNANDLLWRFDMMLLAPGRLPLHVRDAWRAEG